MSRLIVKNLPNGLKEERLRKLFGEQGEVTDCSLKYTRSGQFRNFAFIGYKNEKDAQTALDQLNQTYIDTKKIQIEVARDFGDANKPRAWSKYSKESSANQRLAQESSANQKNADESPANQKKSKKSSANWRTAEENQTDNNEEDSTKQPSKKKKKKKRKENEALNELKDDAGFQEFLEVHQNVSAKPVWTNDGGKTKKSEKEESEMAVDSDDNDDGEDGDIVGHGDVEDVEDEDQIESRNKKCDELLENYCWKTANKPWLKEERISYERHQEIHHSNSVNTKTSKNVRKRQKELGQPLRKGKWSAGEDDILVENVQSYYKDYPLYNPLLLIHSAKCDPKLLKAAKETLLYSRIAEGLNRTLADSYNRLKYILFPEFAYNKGKFSMEEKIHLRKLCSIHGTNWKTIGFKLGRNPNGLQHHWEWMQVTKFGEWAVEEDQLLTETVKQFIKNDKDLHNELPWRAIAKSIPGRSCVQCRNHWMGKLRNRVLHEENCFQTINWKNDQIFELVTQICRQDVNKEEDVDFDHIRKHFQKTGFVVTRDQVRKQWRQLKTKVKNYYIKSFGEILDEVACLVTDT